MIQKSIKEIIDTSYRSYSLYVLQHRAIPSAIDGLKPVQRKLLFSMIKNGGANRKIKIAELGGGLSSFGYHHGESSAQNAAVNMSQDWSNNAPLFEGHGNFGSRMVPESAAPRYIFAKLSENFQKYFSDDEVAPQVDEEDTPEPLHYLPLIPWVLVNGVKGIAVGFATDILPRCPKQLAKACSNVLNGKPIQLLAPTFPEFKGEVVKLSESQWKTQGIVEEKGLQYTISELPVGADRESYVTFLNKMIDDNKIVDYDDLCSEKGFCFVVKVNRAQRDLVRKNVMNYFKLEKTMSENLTTIGHDGSLQVFENVEDLIKYFVEYRLRKVSDKIKYNISEYENKLFYLQHKKNFIYDVISGKINLKLSKKQDVIEYIEQNITENEYGRSFLSLPFYELTSDSLNKLDDKISEVDQDLKYWKSTDEKTEYLTALKSL